MSSSFAFRACAILVLAGVGFYMPGCGAASSSNLDDDAATQDVSGPSAQPADSGPDSVGDVTSGEFPGELSGDQADSPVTGPAVEIRNVSSLAARVTVVFSQQTVQAHVAYVRVVAGTVNTVVSPVSADSAEVSGTLDDGTALVAEAFALGPKGTASALALYVIESPDGAGGGDSSQDPPDDPGNGETPSTLVIHAPATDASLALGSTIKGRWSDEGSSRDAVVVFYLRPVGDGDRTRWIQISPAVSSMLDGINDEMDLVLQSVSPGLYELAGEITNGAESMLALAPGRLSLYHHPGNLAPTIDIVAPEAVVELGNSDFLEVRWVDSDPDSPAEIFISLFGVLESGESVTFPLTAAIPEDADGPEDDTVRVSMHGILPGTYDLVATITDGMLSGVSRRQQSVAITSAGHNDPPTIELLEPVEDVEVAVSGSLYIAWDDQDSDSSAIISLMLDPDLDAEVLDGNEILLISSLAEDPDGPGSDEVRLGLQEDLQPGKYRLAASIADGVHQALTFAEGHVLVLDGGDEQPKLPKVDVVWPLTPQYRLDGGTFSFGVVFENVTDEDLQGRYVLTAELTNAQYSVDLMPISQEQRNGGSRVWTVLPSRFSIPYEVQTRRFDIVLTLREGEQTLSQDKSPAPIWIRRDFRFDFLHIEGVDCSTHRGGNDAGQLRIGWTGGGWEGSNPQTSVLVKLFVAKDGIWPPPLPDDRTHRMIASDWEAFGVAEELVVPWTQIEDMDEGQYILVAVLEDPYYGEIVYPLTDQPFQICQVDAHGGGSMP